MYCGSCSRDNALAVELLARGHQVTLLPLYTPTNPDEANVSHRRVLFGGMAQRLIIAMAALVCQPELLILDEPTTGLDVTIQSEIMTLIVDLCKGRGLTACLITHDLGVVVETCDEVVVMNAGRVVETGSAEAIFTAPKNDYTRKLLAASQLVEAA